MRKSFISILIFFCLCGYSYGAPCYGTKMPKSREVFFGLESYTIFERDLRNDYGKIRSNQGFYLLTYGIWDWLSLDLKVGVGDIDYHSDTAKSMRYPGRFDGGYGCRIRLYDKGKVKLVGGFQHISVHPFVVKTDGKKYKAVLDDWQFSALASYDFLVFCPYIGTRWSRVDYINWIDSNRKREMSDPDRCIGLIAGADIPLGRKAWINIEGEFFDSTALAASINFKF